MRSAPGIAIALLAVSVYGAPARADEISTGIDLHRFVPGIGPGALLGIDGAGAPAQRLSFVAALDFSRGVLSIDNRFTHDAVTQPVRSITALDLSAEASLGRRFSVGVGVPLALSMTGDRLAGLGVGDEAPLRATVAGDLRLRVRFSILDNRLLSLAALVVGTIPLDGKDQFFATSGPTIEPRLVGGSTFARGWLRWSALAGFRFMPTRSIYDRTYSHEGHLAAGLDFHVPRAIADRFHLMAEIEGGFLSRLDYAELRGGLRVIAMPWLSIDVGAGTGAIAGSAPGGPSLRLFTAVRVEL